MNGPNGKRAILVMGNINNSFHCLIGLMCFAPRPIEDWKLSNITHIRIVASIGSEYKEELLKIYLNSLKPRKGCGRPLIIDNLINLMIKSRALYSSYQSLPNYIDCVCVCV